MSSHQPVKKVLKEKARQPVLAPVGSKRAMRDPGNPLSFKKFMAILLSITSGILFMIFNFALLFFGWDLFNNTGRGIHMFAVAAIMFILGLVMNRISLTKRVAVVPFNFTLILVALGFVFLFADAINAGRARQALVMVSLLTMVIVVFSGIYFRYASIVSMGYLGFIAALVNSMFMWAEAGVFASIVFVIISAGLHASAVGRDASWSPAGAVGRFTKTLPLGRPDRYVAVFFIISTLPLMLISTYIAQFQETDPILATRIIGVCSLALLAFVVIYGTVFRSWMLVAVGYLALLVNIFVQSVYVFDMDQGGGAWISLVVSFGAFLVGSIFIGSSPEVPQKALPEAHFHLLFWFGAAGLLPFSIFALQLSDHVDIHSQRFLILFVLAFASMFVNRMSDNLTGRYIGLVLFIIAVLYHGVTRSEMSVYLILFVPLLINSIDGNRERMRVFDHIFMGVVVLCYGILWLAPIHPVPLMQRITDPIGVWWKGSITLVFAYIFVLWGLRKGRLSYMYVGSGLFTFSIIMAMLGEGDSFAFGIFLLPLTRFIFEKFGLHGKGGKIPANRLRIYSMLLLVPSALIYILIFLWFVPVLAPFDVSGPGGVWWKYSIAMAFSLIYLSWGALSGKRLNYLLGTLLLTIATVYIMVLRLEALALIMLLPAVPVFLIELFRPFRYSREPDTRYFRWYYLILLAPVSLVFLMVFVRSADPVMDTDTWLGNNIFWYRIGIMLLIAMPLLIWGWLRRSVIHYWIGSVLAAILLLYASLEKCDLFSFLILLLPVPMYLPGGMSWITPGSAPGRAGSKMVSLASPRKYWRIYEHIQPVLPLIVFTGFGWGPSQIISDLDTAMPLGPVHWMMVILLIFSSLMVVAGLVRKVPLGISIGSFLFFMIVLLYTMSDLDILVYLLLLLPLAVWYLGRRGLGKMEFSGYPGFLIVADLSMAILFIMGLLVMLASPASLLELTSGDRTFFAYKGLLITGLSLAILFWGLWQRSTQYLVAGSVMYLISLSWSAIGIGEPILLAGFLLIPLTALHRDNIARDKPGSVHANLLRSYEFILAILLVMIGILMYVPSINPLFTLTTGSSFDHLYRFVLVALLAGMIIGWGLWDRSTFHYVLGLLYLSAVTFIFAGGTFEPSVFLLLGIPFLNMYFFKRMGWNESSQPGHASIRGIRYLTLVLLGVGSLFLWFHPASPFYHIRTWSWMDLGLRTLMSLTFASVPLALGVFHDRSSAFTLGITMVIVGVFIFTWGAFEPFILVLFVLPLLTYHSMVGHIGPGCSGSSLKWHNILQNLYVIVITLGFLGLWTPFVHDPIIGLDPVAGPFWLYRTAIAVSMALGMMAWGSQTDRSLHFIVGSVLLMLAAVLTAFIVFEPAVFLVFVPPMFLLVHEKVLGRKLFRDQVSYLGEKIDATLTSLVGKPPNWLEALHADWSAYVISRYISVPVAFMGFLVLFLEKFIDVSHPLIELDPNVHLWYICVLMLLFSMVVLVWGLREELKLHAALAATFIITDAWVLGLSSFESTGIGVVVSLGVTTLVSVLGAVYFFRVFSKNKGTTTTKGEPRAPRPRKKRKL